MFHILMNLDNNRHMMRLRILILFFAGLSLPSLTAQTLNAYLKGAREALDRKDFFSAYNYYRVAHEIEPNNAEITYDLADAARLYSAYTMADTFYREVANHKDAAKFPALSFWQGYVKQRLGQYDQALDLYNIYLGEQSGVDTALTAMANRQAEMARWAVEALKVKDSLTHLEHLGPEVNTPFSEFGAHQIDSILYFSSLRFIQPDDDVTQPDLPYTKVLKSIDGGLGEPDSTLNDPVLHTAHTAFNAARDRVYYTLCEYVNTFDIRCDIYFRDIVDSILGLPQKLPEPVNMAGYTTTQPHVGFDPVTGREVLFFASDRPGGKGKLDLWSCQIAGRDNFMAPVNLADLNTPASDMTPFYHRPSNTLYFSSEGYMGFGGLDIFKSGNLGGSWGAPVNLGVPTNSSLDDAFYILSDDEREGYFSSNRLGSMYLAPEDEACCFDIYKFDRTIIEPEPEPRVVLVRTFECRTGARLQGVRVELQDALGGEPIVREETFVDEYFFVLPPDQDYTVMGRKKGYRTASKSFNTADLPEGDTLIVDLCLELGNLEDFLPLAIYFDNDEPGRRSRDERATVRYLETYEPYYAQKDKFIQKYTNGLKDDAEREVAKAAVEDFFQNELARGKREFESFMHILDQYLQEGLIFTIYLKGYTSPLASNEYNLQLGKRRISSIQNEFKSFRDGILWKYMEIGDLVVTQKSFGEETAPKEVSDDRKNPRKSIYSPEASKERRVEIIEIQK